MKFKWNGKNKFLSFLLGIGFVLIPNTGCDNSQTSQGDGFYTYRGYRDWYRIPLKFPYQLLCVDSFDHASLEKYDPKELISDPNISSTCLVSDIIHIGFTSLFVTFQCKTNTQKKNYGILSFATGKIHYFENITQLKDFIVRNTPDKSFPDWYSIEAFYRIMWQTMDELHHCNGNVKK